MKLVTEKKLDTYYSLTQRALRKIHVDTSVTLVPYDVAEEFLDMAKRYVADALYFRKKGDYVTAFAALNYAHAWLDAGARIGVFDVEGDSDLFVVDETWQKKKK